MELLKYCRCGKVIEYTLKACDDCLNEIDKEKKDRYKQYQSTRTDDKEQKFYNTKAWKSLRDRVRARDKFLCKLCLSDERLISADVVHHIRPIKESWNDRLDKDNVICLCDSCHKEVHKRYEENEKSKQEMILILKDILDLES